MKFCGGFGIFCGNLTIFFSEILRYLMEFYKSRGDGFMLQY